MSAKLVPNLRTEGVTWSAQWIPTAVNLVFFPRPGAATFPFEYLLSYPHEAEWTPFQTQYFSENLAGPGIEPETSGYVARNSDH
jgi:hypothetical protein